MLLGTRISMLRKAKGLSQQELASLTGISQTYISKVEKNKRQPTIGKVILISKALGTTIEEILSETDEITYKYKK